VAHTHTYIFFWCIPIYLLKYLLVFFFRHRTIPIVSILSLTYFGRKSISSCSRWTTVVFDHLYRACRPPTVECSRVHCWCRKPNHLKKKDRFQAIEFNHSTHTHTRTRDFIMLNIHTYSITFYIYFCRCRGPIL